MTNEEKESMEKINYPLTVIIDYKFSIGEDGQAECTANRPGELFAWALEEHWLEPNDSDILDVCGQSSHYGVARDIKVCAFYAAQGGKDMPFLVCDECCRNLDAAARKWIDEGADAYHVQWFETPEELESFRRSERSVQEYEDSLFRMEDELYEAGDEML